MIEELEFIEHLGNIKKLMMASPYGRANKTVLKYVDILIDIHQKRFDEYEKNMLEEYTSNELKESVREVYNESNNKVI
tara:strand:- start:2202 stop:2435 length:234 start_codon:yes stop_codon:yes gene_type:complete